MPFYVDPPHLPKITVDWGDGHPFNLSREGTLLAFRGICEWGNIHQIFPAELFRRFTKEEKTLMPSLLHDAVVASCFDANPGDPWAVATFFRDLFDRIPAQEVRQLRKNLYEISRTQPFRVLAKRYGSQLYSTSDVWLILNHYEEYLREQAIGEARKVINRARRAKFARLPEELRQAVFDRDHARCVYCGATTDLEPDHVVPLSKGGSDRPENLRTACHRCNIKKGNKLLMSPPNGTKGA